MIEDETGGSDGEYFFYIVCAGCDYQWQGAAIAEAIEGGGSLSLSNDDGSCPRCGRQLQPGDRFDLMKSHGGMPSELIRTYIMPEAT